MPIIKQYICDKCGAEIMEKHVHTWIRVYLHKDLILTNPRNSAITKNPAEQRKEAHILCAKCSDEAWKLK